MSPAFADPTPPPPAPSPRNIRDLQARLAKSPGDLDTRLELARELNRRGATAAATVEANKIIKAAPRYWDAHLLLARIDAREGRYDQALARIYKVRGQAPYHDEAVVLWADVALWSNDGGETKKALHVMEQMHGGKTADIYYRYAALRFNELDAFSARSLAQRALELEADNEKARRLKKDIRLASFEAAFDTERFSINNMGGDQSWGVIMSLAALPRARASATAIYEYRRRFLTNNHRIGFRGDVRLTESFSVFAFFLAGSVDVIPELVVQFGADYQLWERYGFSLAYRLDQMTWPGKLHRLQPAFGVNLPHKVRAEGGMELGMLASCGDRRFIPGAWARASWIPKPVGVSLAYYFGAEAERPALTGLPAGTDPCPTLDTPLEINRLNLVQTQSHTVAAGLEIFIDESTSFRTGYALQARFRGDTVHTISAAVRKHF